MKLHTLPTPELWKMHFASNFKDEAVKNELRHRRFPGQGVDELRGARGVMDCMKKWAKDRGVLCV